MRTPGGQFRVFGDKMFNLVSFSCRLFLDTVKNSLAISFTLIWLTVYKPGILLCRLPIWFLLKLQVKISPCCHTVQKRKIPPLFLPWLKLETCFWKVVLPRRLEVVLKRQYTRCLPISGKRYSAHSWDQLALYSKTRNSEPQLDVKE